MNNQFHLINLIRKRRQSDFGEGIEDEFYAPYRNKRRKDDDEEQTQWLTCVTTAVASSHRKKRKKRGANKIRRGAG